MVEHFLGKAEAISSILIVGFLSADLYKGPLPKKAKRPFITDFLGLIPHKGVYAQKDFYSYGRRRFSAYTPFNSEDSPMIAYIRLRSFDPKCLEDAWTRLARSDARWVGLPTTQKLYTLLRSPHVHKKARDQFYFQVNNALCTLPNPSLFELMECSALRGVECTIRIVGRTSFPKDV